MRLIDADELMEHAARERLDSRELILQMIENAPTIKPNLMIIKEIFKNTINLNESTYKVLEQICNEWNIMSQKKKDIIINALCY